MPNEIEQLKAKIEQLEKDKVYLVRCAENHSEARVTANNSVKVLKTALLKASIGSCSCMTKTPDYKYHAESCNYRFIGEALATTQPSQQTGDDPTLMQDLKKFGEKLQLNDDTALLDWLEKNIEYVPYVVTSYFRFDIGWFQERPTIRQAIRNAMKKGEPIREHLDGGCP